LRFSTQGPIRLAVFEGVSMSTEVRVNVHAQGNKTEELVCNWCGLPHPVEPAYRQEVLERGRKEVEEYKSKLVVFTPEETWTCGKCFLHLHGLPDFVIEVVKTECDHEVPTERYK
jgi:hypothetical protein